MQKKHQGDGRVFFFSEQQRLVCLGADAKKAWAFDKPEFISRLPRPSRFANINTEAISTLILGQKGTLLWEDKLTAPKCIFLDATFLSPSGVFDAFPGSKVGDARVTGSGCGIMKWGPGLADAVNHTSFGVKSPCGVGAFTATGLLHIAPSQCDRWSRSVAHPGFTAWQLTALDRITGKEHRTVNLPAEPIFNALAPAAAGRWTLSLRDGNLAIVE